MSQATRILLALALGLLLGIASAKWGAAWASQAVTVAEPIGGVWLNALQMTIVPLVVSLLITASPLRLRRRGRASWRREL